MWVDCVDRVDHETLVPVRLCTSRGQAEQYALVLAAMGVPSTMMPEDGLIMLFVVHRDAANATSELAAYDRENNTAPPPFDETLPALPRLELVLGFWATLLFLFAAARHEAFSLDWLGTGAAQSGLMLGGEWWRAVTALFLHVNSVNLLGNLVFGTIFSCS